MPQSRVVATVRWVTREHVRTVQTRRRSVWHLWFAWYPVVVKVEGEFDHWVWLEHLERKWSVSHYGEQKVHWRYRYPVVRAERANLAEHPDRNPRWVQCWPGKLILRAGVWRPRMAIKKEEARSVLSEYDRWAKKHPSQASMMGSPNS